MRALCRSARTTSASRKKPRRRSEKSHTNALIEKVIGHHKACIVGADLDFDIAFGGTAGHCQAKDKLRSDAVKGTDAFHATDDIGHMRAEDPAVSVDLIDDDEAEVLEELLPLERLSTLSHGGRHHRKRVAQGLAGGGRCRNNEIAHLSRCCPGVGLVRIERTHTASPQCLSKRRREIRTEWAEIRRAPGNSELSGDALCVAIGKAAGKLTARGRRGRQRPGVQDRVQGRPRIGGPVLAAGGSRTETDKL